MGRIIVGAWLIARLNTHVRIWKKKQAGSNYEVCWQKRTEMYWELHTQNQEIVAKQIAGVWVWGNDYGWVALFALFVFCRWWKTEKYSYRSSDTSMRSYPPQYPRSSNQSPSLFLFSLCPPHQVFFSFSSFFPLISLVFFLSFSLCFLSFFLPFFPPFPRFFTLSTCFCVCVCVCVRVSSYVCACVFGNSMCVGQC